jgi:carboxyl-terminal processing protease
VVVGSPTFGKGTVQALVPLGDGQLKLTQAKFYRVSGGSTQHRGVVPDVALPSTYPADEVGESALPDALPWDSVPALRHRRGPAIDAGALQRAHDERAARDPDLVRQARRLAVLEEIRERPSVSLHEGLRKEARERDLARLLAIENDWRAARGLEPLLHLDLRDAVHPRSAPDAFAREAANVLIDAAIHAGAGSLQGAARREQ